MAVVYHTIALQQTPTQRYCRWSGELLDRHTRSSAKDTFRDQCFTEPLTQQPEQERLAQGCLSRRLSEDHTRQMTDCPPEPVGDSDNLWYTRDMPDAALIPRNQYHPIATKAMQKAALAAIEEHGTLVAAAKVLGIDPHTISRWCKKSDAYRDKVREAQAFSDHYHTLDAIKANFKDRALAGKEDGQSAIIGMFLAKKIDPTYRDNAVLAINAQGPVAVQLNFGASPQVTQAGAQADESNMVNP